MKTILVGLGQLIGYCVTFGAFTILLMTFFAVVFGNLETLDILFIMVAQGSIMVLVLSLLNGTMIKVFHSPFAGAGWPKFRTSLSWFGAGCLYGLGLAGAMFALTFLLGGGRLVFVEGNVVLYFQRVIPFLGGLLLAALSEEWLFRGYPLNKLSSLFSRGWANMILALLFALVHMGNPGWNLLAAGNICLASLMLGALRYTPGGIPVAWGVHFTWNGVQMVLGSPVTGTDLGIPLIHFEGLGPDWLSGGSIGPEGGLGATFATILALSVLIRYFIRHNQELPLPGGKRLKLTKQMGL